MSRGLSDFYIQKAKNELRENEERKRQSFEILRNWALKHPFIKFKDPECLTIERLLPYMRTRKYFMDKIYESFEKYLSSLKHHKNWSNYSGEGFDRALKLYDSGYFIVSKERDSEGRRVLICTNKFDYETFHFDDIFRLSEMILFTILMEEETQISGVIFISDARFVNMSYIARIPLRDAYDISKELNIAPVRVQGIIMLGLPTFAQHVWNLTKAAYSEKIAKRIASVNDVSDLSDYVDISILPKEYGGTYTISESIKDFRPYLIERTKDFNEFLNKFDVDFYKANKYKNVYETDMVGSFRKLNID